MDSEIRSIERTDITVDASVHSFLSRVNREIETKISIVANSGTSNRHVLGYTSLVDNAMTSTAADLEASHVQSFDSVVDNAVERSSVADLETSRVHGYSSIVYNHMESNTSTITAQPAPQAISNVTAHVAEGFRLFNLAEIEAATNSFSPENKIGGGGGLYKGKLEDGIEVAIKKTSKTKRLVEEESVSEPELQFLSPLHHKNLVRLVGLCEEKDERFLIYQYMKNGSLYDHLHGKNNVEKGSSVLNSWKMRIKIALDVARGIEYLHEYATPSIIHRDIKSSNILLDEAWTARVSDFGSSMMSPKPDREYLPIMKAAGNVGYSDRVYYGRNVFKAKCVDVFGLGVVMLELLTGKSTILKHGKDGDTPLKLINFEVPTISDEDTVSTRLDPRVGEPDQNEENALNMFTITAKKCVVMTWNISEVVGRLEKALISCGSSYGSISRDTITIGSGHINKAEVFSLAELVAATDNFSLDNKIGAGSFGVVYKGKLSDGREVAIKRGETVSKMNKFQHKLSAFESELTFLSRLHHKHLVRLVGYCEEKDERLLVFEYMENGSLYDILHDKNNVKKLGSALNSWEMRFKIALDAASGIDYLHKYAFPSIIHRDIKSSNILIDSTWTARVSDFGLSLISPEPDHDHKPTILAGTEGYIDPEYSDQNVLTVKSDVYSFGVVLLELLTGERAMKLKHGEDGDTKSKLVDFALPRISAGYVEDILDPRVGLGEFDWNIEDAVYLVANIAKRCLRLEGKDRPTMAEILVDLERALYLSDSMA